MSGFTLLALGVAAVFGVGILFTVVSNSPPSSPAPEVRQQQPRIDKSPETQAKRKSLIKRLIAEGVFQKVEVPGNLPRVWVTARFKALLFDDKQQFISVVYAYYFNGNGFTDTVLVYDNLNGREIGQYNPNLGGLKLK